MTRRLAASVVLIVVACGCASRATSKPALPTIDDVIAAKTDLWGEAALREPGGPSYAFFESLLPPLRYVDADFRHYPIVRPSGSRRRNSTFPGAFRSGSVTSASM